MNLKKWLAVGLAAALSTTTFTAGAMAKTKAPIAKIDLSKRVTVSITVMGDPPAGRADKAVVAAMNKILEKKINTDISLNWISWNDYATKYNLLLASGQNLDLIYSTSTWLDLFKNAERGAFMPLDSLIPKYAPKLWADTKKVEWDQCKYKGKIYALPGDRHMQYSTPVLVYRQDWASSFGIPNGEIKSIEQVEKYWNGIKTKMPNIIPYAAAGSAASNEFLSMYFRQKTKLVEGPGGTGMFTAVFENSTKDLFTAVNAIEQPWFLDFAKLCKKWGDAGYWSQDVLNTTSDTKSSFEAGLSGTYTCNLANYPQILTDMAKSNKSAKVNAFFFDGAPRNLIMKDVVTQDCTSIGSNSKNPERALMVYDLLMYDKELYQLSQYGIKGVQYDLNSKGQRVQPKSYVKAKDEYFWDLWGSRNDKLEIPSANDWTGMAPLMKKLAKIAVDNPYGSFIFDPAPVNQQLTAISAVCTKYGPAIMYGKAGDPVKAVQEFRDALKTAGIVEYIKELNSQMAKYKATLK